MEIKKIEKIILKIAIEIAKSGEGALFVIGEGINYERLLEQKFKSFSVFDTGSRKLLKALGIIDGAVIIDNKGIVREYGVMIKKTRAFVGYGTRHAAAITASKDKNIVILASEEERKVKVFKGGKYIMQIDALQKNVEKKISVISRILESTGVGAIGTIGVITLIPKLGITLIPGIIIFGGSYYAIKKIIKRASKK